MDWATIQQAMGTLRPAHGGFSAAQRGIVTLPNDVTVFVKMATDAQTREWVEIEKKAYHWLERAGYRHAPRLLAEGEGGFALADLSECDWMHTWDDAKVHAMLTALDDLVALSVADADFTQSAFPEDPWRSLPNSADVYAPFLDEDSLRLVESVLGDEALRTQYAAIADSEPWRGQELVHYDARSDNFAYDRAAGVGYLVDWNWIGLGSAAFDRTSVLVNVQLAGYDVLAKHASRLDKASLVWLMGFWLKSALGPQDTENLKRLRPRQVANALTAHKLIQNLG